MLEQIIPESFVVEKFYEHAGYPRYKRTMNVYEGGCPLCREGKSWGKKRRLYYVVKDSRIFCHNCGWAGDPIRWIAEVQGQNAFEVIREAKDIEHDYVPQDVEIERDTNNDSLPGECINLFDEGQTAFYSNDKVVSIALDYIKQRRLDTAINKPKTLWLCKEDRIHKNRIIIPFYDNKDIVFYQSRGLLESDTKPKYLSKLNAEKSVFNYDNISSVAPAIFIFEGPIDSFFVKNGVAVGGIQSSSKNTFTPTQEQQINSYPFYEKIWVLDNQHIDQSAREKTEILLREGHKCFIWPRELRGYKDFNDICTRIGRDEITPPFVMSNSYSGIEGIVKLKLL